MPTRNSVIVVCVLALALAARDAHAYIDPGTGSAILQAIVAAILAAGLVLQVFWQRIRAFVASLFSRRRKNTEPETDV